MAGQTGPLSYKAGYDYIGQAYAGVTDGIGEIDRAPATVTMAIGDVSTGVAAAMAVGFALLHRERTGEGQYLDGSLLDTYFHMHDSNVPMVSLRGDKYRPTRGGSQHPQGGPTGTYHYRGDQYIFLTIPTAPSMASIRQGDGQAGTRRRSAFQERARPPRQQCGAAKDHRGLACDFSDARRRDRGARQGTRPLRARADGERGSQASASQ